MGSHELPKRAKERRRAPRTRPEELVAYYWTGSVPKPRQVRDVGLYGGFIVASETFYPGTVVQVVLEDRADGRITGGPGANICVYAKALRREPDGFPVSFLFEDRWERRRFRSFLENLKLEEPVPPENPEPVAEEEPDGQAAKAKHDEPKKQAVPGRLQGGPQWHPV